MRGPGGEWLSLAEFIAGAEVEKSVNRLMFNDLGARIDAEYYQPHYVNLAARIEKYSSLVPLREVSHSIRKGIFDISPNKYCDNGIPFIRVSDIQDGFLDSSNLVHISEEDHLAEAKTELQSGDIVISKVGTIGRVGLIQGKHSKCNYSQNVLGIRVDRTKIIPEYLSIFLNSVVGQRLILRTQMLQVQSKLELESIRNLRIVLPDMLFQEEIKGLVETSVEKRLLSQKLYQEAENTLLEALGLNSLDLLPQLSYTATFEQALHDNRFDAEHFQPKYYSTLEAIRRLNPKEMLPLSDLLSLLTNGHTPTRHNLTEGDIIFLTAEHILDFKLNLDSDKRILKAHHETMLSRTRLQDGDVLVTIKGRVGNVAVVEGLQQPTNINQDVALLRLKRGYHPYYVTGLLNSAAGKMLTEHASTGQINPFLSLTNLQRILIPIFEPERMNELGEAVEQKVNQARKAEHEAKGLLESAKCRVEALILGEG